MSALALYENTCSALLVCEWLCERVCVCVCCVMHVQYVLPEYTCVLCCIIWDLKACQALVSRLRKPLTSVRPLPEERSKARVSRRVCRCRTQIPLKHTNTHKLTAWSGLKFRWSNIQKSLWFFFKDKLTVFHCFDTFGYNIWTTKMSCLYKDRGHCVCESDINF